MAVNPEWTFRSPGQVNDTDGSNPMTYIVGTGAPDGDAEPQTTADVGSLYFRTDQTVGQSPLYVKYGTASSDNDWTQVLLQDDEGTVSIEGSWTWDADNSIYFRDSGLRMYSSADGQLNIRLSGSDYVTIGGAANYTKIDVNGNISLAGTAKVVKNLPLPVTDSGGTSTEEMWNNAPSINLDATDETWYASFVVPRDWDAASDMKYVAYVGNEIAETDGNDVIMALTVAGFADGETAGTAGQTVSIAQNLTGGDQAINKVNIVTGTIDYDNGGYPIADGDVVHIKGAVTLSTAAGTATGPLHIVAHHIRYTASRLGSTA